MLSIHFFTAGVSHGMGLSKLSFDKGILDISQVLFRATFPNKFYDNREHIEIDSLGELPRHSK